MMAKERVALSAESGKSIFIFSTSLRAQARTGGSPTLLATRVGNYIEGRHSLSKERGASKEVEVPGQLLSLQVRK